MIDKEMLEAMQLLLQQELKPINHRLDNLEGKFNGVNDKLDNLESEFNGVKDKLDIMEEDIKQIKEDTAITRAATNSLLDWADDASIQVVPLFKKRKAD